jgi:hypothetical protein
MAETITPGGLPENLLSDELTHDIQVTRAQNRSLCLAVGFQRMSGQSDAWKLFLRYQAQTERLYRRAIEDFERLKALRSELPNEPIADLEPEEILFAEARSANPPVNLFGPTVAVTSPIPPSFRPEKKDPRPNTGPGS